MSFYLFGESNEKLRLKSVSSSLRGNKSVIKIELETSDPFEFGHALQSLAKVQAGQRARPSKPKPSKPLALPAPHSAKPDLEEL